MGCLVNMGVVADWVIDYAVFEKHGLTEILKVRQLIKSAAFAKFYGPSLVGGFYYNLSPTIDDLAGWTFH